MGAESKPAPAAPADAAAGCEEVACRSKGDMFRAMRRMGAPAGGSSPVQQSQPHGGAQEPPECPPFREDLGRCSWTLMHTLAAHYPRSPSAYEQAHAAAFYRALAALYPCTHCREDFHTAVAADPPRVESREALAVWLCGQHNAVNAKLGKPQFPCDFATLDTRWRTGMPACWAASEERGETAAQSLGQQDER